MSDNTFSTKPGALDGLELGKPIGGGSSLSHTSDLTSSTGTTGTTGLTGTHSGLTGGATSSDPARNVADTPAGVAAGFGAGHHNQGSIHAPTSGSSGLTSGAGGLTGTTDRLAQATATSGNTPTGPIGGNPVSRDANLTDYNDKDIVTPNVGSGAHGHHGSAAGLGAGAAAGAAGAGLASHGTHGTHGDYDSSRFNTAPVVGSGTTGHNHLHTGAALEGLSGHPSGHRVDQPELANEDRKGIAAEHGAAGRGLEGTGVHNDGRPAEDHHALSHGVHNTTAGDRGLTGTSHGGPTAYESDASRVGGHHGAGTATGAGLAGAGLAGAGAAASGTHGYGSATQGSGVGHGVVGTAGGADATDANRGTGLTGRTGAGLAGAGAAASGLSGSGSHGTNAVDALKQELKEHQSGTSHSSHPESQGPHGLVWHNGKYVHQRELDQHGSTGVPLANAFKDPKSGGEHGVNTNTDANNTRV